MVAAKCFKYRFHRFSTEAVTESMHLIRSAERDARRRHFTDICHCELNEINSGGSKNTYILLSLSKLEIFAKKARPSAPAAENFPLKRHWRLTIIAWSGTWNLREKARPSAPDPEFFPRLAPREQAFGTFVSGGLCCCPGGSNPLKSPDREQRGDGGRTSPTGVTDFIFTEFNNSNFTRIST
jgi:hypothetical protein